MKTRWIAAIGRTGSSLLVLGLALALVLIIPPMPSGGKWGVRGARRPFSYTHDFRGLFFLQTGLRISVTSNATFQLYLLATTPLQMTQQIRSWLAEEYPTMNGTQIYELSHNASIFETYLQAYSQDILLQASIDEEWSIEFYPPKMTNVTFVYSNPSPTSVNFDLWVTEVTTLVVKEQVLVPTVVLIVSGAVLAVPWSVQRRNKPK